MTQYIMESDEFNEISFALEKHHTLFYKLWTMGRPEFTDSIPTACVGFNAAGKCITFKINPTFWQAQTFTQKLFIICHEAKHVVGNHGYRASHLKTKEDHELANIAMDLCVNHDLVDRFGFVRAEVDPDNVYVWADRVAELLDLPALPEDKSFEFYFDLLKSQPPSSIEKMKSEIGTLDDHDGLSEITDEEVREVMSEMANDDLSDEDKQRISDLLNGDGDGSAVGAGQGRGNTSLGALFEVKVEIVKHKRKWETVIKKWMNKAIKVVERETQQWMTPSRRFALIDTDLSLPGDVVSDVNKHEKTKLKVMFFLDTSGSCIGYRDRFFRAAKTLPDDRFEISLFCFDTKVYPTDIAKGRVYGGGGTSLACVETFIRKNTVAKGIKYPDAVFLITDADGTPANPIHPERWYWFLTDRYAEKHVPQKSHRFDLKDYE